MLGFLFSSLMVETYTKIGQTSQNAHLYTSLEHTKKLLHERRFTTHIRRYRKRVPLLQNHELVKSVRAVLVAAEITASEALGR